MARFIDEVECVLAVLLAIGLGRMTGAGNVSWAAFSACMVMRGHFADSATRGGLRIVGTVVGGGLAWLLAPVVAPCWPPASLACALVTAASLYGALALRAAYAWLLVGMTFGMVLLDAMAHPADPVQQFAMTRLLEVHVGTMAALAVSAVSTWTVRRRWPALPVEEAPMAGWLPHAGCHAAQGAIAVALLPVAWKLFQVPALSQGVVSISAVMFVPAASVAQGGIRTISRRVGLRIFGCLAGCLFAIPLAWLADGRGAVLMAGTVAGVMLGRHVENSRKPFAYAGMQFTLAVLVTLVPDDLEHVTLEPALERVTGIVLGLAALELVLVSWKLLDLAAHSKLIRNKRIPDVQ